MFKIQEIREMIKLVDQSSIQHLEVAEGNSKISIQRGAVSVTVDNTTLANYDVVETPAIVPKSTVKEISKAPLQVAAAMETAEKVHSAPKNELNENLAKIVSPMVGTFYQAPGEDAAPFVEVGEKVVKSTVVCILEAMKLFNEIEAEMDGEIVEVLVENGQLVEYGQPLFIVKQKS